MMVMYGFGYIIFKEGKKRKCEKCVFLSLLWCKHLRKGNFIIHVKYLKCLNQNRI